jgi:hypothetical protein
MKTVSVSKGCPTLADDDVFAEADRENDHLKIRESARQV